MDFDFIYVCSYCSLSYIPYVKGKKNNGLKISESHEFLTAAPMHRSYRFLFFPYVSFTGFEIVLILLYAQPISALHTVLLTTFAS